MNVTPADSRKLWLNLACLWFMLPLLIHWPIFHDFMKGGSMFEVLA